MNKIIAVLLFILTITSYHKSFTYVDKEINIFKEVPIVKKKEEKKKENKKENKKEEKVLKTYYGNITAYGPDCTGCSGITASGHNAYKSIYYQDKKYGKVRIVAADKTLPFGTIVRIKNVFHDPILAIVLDRGGAIGFNKNVYFDLLYKSEKSTISFGKKKATFEILRKGY